MEIVHNQSPVNEHILRPSQIRFSRDCIGHKIYGGWTLFQTLKSLKDGIITPETLPSIEVMMKDTKYYVVNGNRRLYMYKLLEQQGIIQYIPVNVVPYDDDFFVSSGKFTTTNDGESVTIRNLPSLPAELLSMLNGTVTTEPLYPVTRRRHFYHDDSDSDEFEFGSPFLW